MNKKAFHADILLLFTACIWGFAFVPQKTSMEHVGPFTYSCIRFLLGGVSLIPLIYFRSRRIKIKGVKQAAVDWRHLIPASLLVGSALFFAVNFQQMGLIYINPGNAGFITGMYVVFVPIFGIFLGKKTGLPTWIGAALAFLGLFCVSIAADFPAENNNENIISSFALAVQAVNKGDALVLVSAFLWTFHVLFIDAMVKKVDAIQLSFGQCAVCGLLSLAAAAMDITELTGARAEALSLAAQGIIKPLGPELFSPELTLAVFSGGLTQILYGGLLAVGIAYTLQIVAQQHAPPAHATIILSLESVFAALGGILLTAESVNAAKIAGFALILSGMLATQWDVIAGRRKKIRPL